MFDASAGRGVGGGAGPGGLSKMCYMHFAINFRGNQSKDTSWLENVVKLETISISRLHLLVRSIFIPTKKGVWPFVVFLQM